MKSARFSFMRADKEIISVLLTAAWYFMPLLLCFFTCVSLDVPKQYFECILDASRQKKQQQKYTPSTTGGDDALLIDNKQRRGGAALNTHQFSMSNNKIWMRVMWL